MRPSSLYRSDSRRQPTIEANANNIHKGVALHAAIRLRFFTTNAYILDSIDCGITALKCCNTPGCQKLGNKRLFMAVLVFCALIQGAIETYFRISGKQAAMTHDFDPRIVGKYFAFNGESTSRLLDPLDRRLASRVERDIYGNIRDHRVILGQPDPPNGMARRIVHASVCSLPHRCSTDNRSQVG